MIEKEKYIRAWEKRVGETTCHLDYNDVLKKSDLQKMFKRVTADQELDGAKVLDYGCGGGLFGEYLFKHFQIKSYSGRDVAARAAAKAIERLVDIAGTDDSDVGLVDPYPDLITEEYDYIFCLNVIQHMPDKEHLDRLLSVFNLSGAKKIILNFRAGDKLAFNKTPYKTTHEINLANVCDMGYIDKQLVEYKRVKTYKKKNDLFQAAVYECR